MSEQVNPTGEEIEETVVEVEEVSENEAPGKGAPKTAAKGRGANYGDDDEDEYDFSEYDEYEADDDFNVREVDGPALYAPRQKRGRNQRIGNDVKLEDINYKRVAILTRFLDPRGRILSRRKTRVSAKIQRRAAKEIKRARHLALLPYTADQTRITRKRSR
ncbi:MAG: 30S ribosomal protein S18 [Caldilineaceae bacterium]|nr:30S ribosomal protein S18 [Caldilineaceae bacterium]